MQKVTDSQYKKKTTIDSFFKSKPIKSENNMKKDEMKSDTKLPLHDMELFSDLFHSNPVEDHSDGSSPKPEFADSTPSMEISLSAPKPRTNINIVTPNWDCHNNSTIKIEQSDLVEQKQMNMHYCLEVLEHRIQQGDDKTHDHPGQSVNVYLSSGVGALTPEEQYLRNSYAFKKPDNIVPSFWPSRVWDYQNQTLTAQESNRLMSDGFKLMNRARQHVKKNQEDDFKPSDDSDEFEEPEEILPRRTRNLKSHSTMVTRSSGEPIDSDNIISSTLFCVSTKYFSTDNTDDESEPENY